MTASPSQEYPAGWLLQREFHANAQQLFEIVDALLHQASVPPARLRNLVRRIVVEVREIGDLRQCIPDPGFDVPTLVEPCRWPADAAVRARGLVTAGLMVAVVDRFSDPTLGGFLHLESLIAAALLQDAGWLTMPEVRSSRRGRFDSDALSRLREHPRWSAALAAGIDGISTAVVRLLAHHHERIDGTGYPRGLEADSLRTADRLLGIVCRFVELLETAEPPNARHHREQRWLSVLESLWQETTHGEWDQRLASLVIEAIVDALPVGIRQPGGDVRFPWIVRSGLRRDPAHAGWRVQRPPWHRSSHRQGDGRYSHDTAASEGDHRGEPASASP